MSKHYDTLETRSPAEREKALMQALPQQIANAKENAPFFAEWLKDVDPGRPSPRARRSPGCRCCASRCWARCRRSSRRWAA